MILTLVGAALQRCGNRPLFLTGFSRRGARAKTSLSFRPSHSDSDSATEEPAASVERTLLSAAVDLDLEGHATTTNDDDPVERRRFSTAYTEGSGKGTSSLVPNDAP